MKTLFIIDPGHGGEDPKTGKYVTPGKRSPKDENGDVILFEGINNRINAKLIVDEMTLRGFDVIDIVNDWRDVALNERCRRANELSKNFKCVYISIHSDGAGNGVDWYGARGNGVFVYTGASKNSVRLAECLEQEIKCNFADVTKWRGIREANFAVLRATNCPAVLCEFGFHTHKEEAKLMLTYGWRELLVKSIVDACALYEIN